MKTFKQFLREGNTEEEDFEIYFNFVANALRGGNPQAVDAHYKANRRSINLIAAKCVEKFSPPRKKIYRGILLEDQYVKNNTFKPMHNILYMSFSEDKNVALEFGDPHSWMSGSFMSQNPNAKGYIIEHHPKAKEILFHWTWYQKIGLHRIPGDDSTTIIQQKEVIIRQTGQRLNLVPYNRKML